MEKYFKPVHSPCGPDEMKPQKHLRHHHLHLHQDPQSHRFDETGRNADETHGHCHQQQSHYHHDNPHHDASRRNTSQFHHSEEDEILYSHKTPVTLSRASSSSLSSSSSSSSFSSWFTESSANELFSLRHAEQPQHSLSCSNIADVRRGFREDEGEPVVFATIKHGKSGSVCSELHQRPHKKQKYEYSPLDRGLSRSDEGLLQGHEGGHEGDRPGVPPINPRPLYKAASLNRSLAFSEENIVLGVSRGPKRAVSSTQLPSKGILKNKEPKSDIRKAKSMEVLSHRVSSGQDPSGQKGKGLTQVEIEKARASIVKGKLQFSAFLDEITKQVISPSDLTILGVNNNKATEKTSAPAQTSGSVKPQLPPKKHRESSGEEREQKTRKEKTACSSSRKHSDCSDPDKLTSYPAKSHQGSPPPQQFSHFPSHSTHHGSSRKDRGPSPSRHSVSGDRYSRCGPHLTDGTSTSPELSQPKQHHHRKQQPAAPYGQHTQHFPQHQPQQEQPIARPGLGSESSSTKSDSSMTRDTVSTATSQSSGQSSQHHSHHVGHSKQCRDPPWDVDHLRALQEENADLQQNLLQTVVCIEGLEVELQRTRDELSHVKEKYKSLLETHTGTKHANNLLGEHLHIASESLSSERKYLLNRVSQLSSELEDAHRTVAVLENINVPCLIKELLEKHFESPQAIQKLLMTPASISNCATSPLREDQSQAPKMEIAAHDWLAKSEAGPKRVTAFIPVKHGVPTTGSEGNLPGQHESSHSPPISVDDMSTAIYKKMAASYAARPQPLYPQSQQQPPMGINHTGTPPNLKQAHGGGVSVGGKGGVQVTLLEEDIVDVTAMSAQQILDEFVQQLQPNKEAKEQPAGTEHAGKAAD